MRNFLFVALAFVPAVALAAPRTFQELTEMTIGLINAGIGISILLGIVIYFYGIATNIPSGGHHGGDTEALRTHLLWGLIAVFVMVSVWGIVGLLRNTLFGGGGGANLGGDFSEGGCNSATTCLEGE